MQGKKSLISKQLTKLICEVDPASEQEYIIRISHGDANAFYVIYIYYSSRIYGKLVKVLKSKELASDILQDLFSIIWQKRKEIHPNKSFSAFLFKISDNLMIDLFPGIVGNQGEFH